jgi:hypothetical protein
MTHDVGDGLHHPDVDRLAELDAGGDVDAAFRAHAASCPDCQDILTALQATRRDVEALPAVTMPPEVAARIDTALEAEGARRTKSTVVPLGEHRTGRRRGGMIAGGIAASVLALLIVGIVLNAMGGGHKPSTTSNAAASTSSALGTQGKSVVTISGRKYTEANLDSNIAALLRAPSSSFAAGTSGAGAAGRPASPPAAQHPSAPLSDGLRPDAQTAQAIPPQLTVLQTDANAMGQCISSLLDRPPFVPPVAVDIADYNGKPAAIFVFPKPNDPAHVRVYVVPPGGCSDGFFEFFKASVPR